MSDRWPNLGVLALIVAIGGLLTGPILALNYAPTLESARDSVAYIDGEVTLGWFLRSIHHWAGSLAIVLAAAHAVRVFWRGEYKAPGRAAWVLGCLVFLVLVAFAYTGYLLPGDDRAYTGMGVMRGIAESTPIVGSQAAAVVSGGPAVSSATLTRLNVAHTVLLPAALMSLAAAYVVRRRFAGGGVGAARHGLVLRNTLAASLAVIVLLVLLALILPATLGPAFDPGGGASADARPEWFFLWVNELLRLVPGSEFLVGALLPGGLVAAALLLPFLARGRDIRPARRKLEIAAVALLLLGIAALTASSMAAAASVDEGLEPGGPAATAATAASAGLEDRAAAVLRRYRCSKCHAIDGDEGGSDLGPPLWRDGARNRPPFRTLYSREYFRLRVSNPRAFWPDTGMVYPKDAGNPSKEDLETLEQWFYDVNSRASGPNHK